MKFFNRGENVEKLSEEEKKRTAKEKDKAVMEFLSGFLGEYFTEPPPASGERREVKMEAPKNRDEILLEILKELKELNANVKDMSARLEKKLDDIYRGV